ncbi:copper resistance protein CopC [Lysinibacillus sp. NPDC096418]|uniref:copper resistance CopC family protein n=1 Tax=Lysinibacillus sp. NPDC096418 TaxID=3364138 RepID=UPI00381AFEC5
MKHIFTAAVTVLLVMSLSTSAFAHSHFGGSKPADGDVITEPLNEIILNFDGQIEQGSFIDVTTVSGQVIELKETIIGEGTLTGTVAEPLPNDEYKVNWSIISKDGHPLEGNFSFTVNDPASKTVEKEPLETTNAVEESAESASADEGEKESSSTTIILIVVLVILVAGGFFFLTRRKK